MNPSTSSRYALTCWVAAALLAGCGGSQPPISASSAVAQAPASTGYKSLYSFGKHHDGQQPKAGLIDVNGMLYGTTYGGGAHGDGTIFRMSTDGSEKVLYSFQGGNDGANPSASLLAVKGVLYGTTEYGGGVDAVGTVFKVRTSGREKVLHNFGPDPDGANPVASLIDVKGTLYGTTSRGGSSEFYGTVFRISTSGREKVLHSFAVYSDGAIPLANLIDVNGTLYGTTEAGGSHSSYGPGAVFSISTTGTEKVLFYFLGSNGAVPEAGLIDVNGTLYGTTAYGGADGGGTAFGITIPLHSFGSGSDGSRPAAPLLNVKGTLYGTTGGGGTYGKGTVFSMSLTGKEKVLHSFGYGSDGATPLAGLINVKGTLYGTTSAGGTNGKGTVFALTP
jgi:uncharacterized repeat protein (TIGR03803 family)